MKIKSGIMLLLLSVVISDMVAGKDPHSEKVENEATDADKKSDVKVDCPKGPFLAGQKIDVSVSVAAGAGKFQWQFGYKKERMASGKIKFDENTNATIAIEAPSVRHRTVFNFLLLTAGETISKPVCIYPSSVLEQSAKIIKRFNLGVIDDSGETVKALKSEKVEFEHLNSQLERDSFTGGAVILTGVKDADEFSDLCKRFSSRLEKGMIILLVNPPYGWQQWGIGQLRLKKPFITAPIKMDKSFAEYTISADVGEAPWKTVLKYKNSKEYKTLTWLRADANENKEKSGVERKTYPLIVEKKQGHGTIIAARMPQLSNPNSNAVGRRMLCDLVLRMVAKSQKNGRNKGEKDE